MSTTVYQTIVSCFEPQLTETIATVIKLKVAPQPGANLEFSNWDCYQTSSNNPTNCKEFLENESFYTHPLAKKSSFSRLSTKSLELCTENLGSETGDTDIFTDSSSIFSSSSSSSYSSSSSSSSFNQEDSSVYKGDDRGKLRSKMKSRNEEVGSRRKFPPPLTTMSGSSSFQMRRHHEGGRLIIEAVETPFRNSYLQAERSDGRLRLCYLTDSECDSDLDSDGAAPSEVEVEVEEPRNEEFDVEKFQRLSRCMERRHENEGLCSSNWKHTLWVASS